MKLSFLTACMDRLHHLKETYLYNISQSKSISKCDVEFVLLNYNSSDDIDEWVKLNTQNLDIEFKYLKLENAKYYSPSIAKNILGKNATGDLMCWLDADNYTENGFVKFVENSFSDNFDQIMKVTWSQANAGTIGRIVCSKANFMKIRGYDESFVGWGYEDVDFIDRLSRFGLSHIEIPSQFLRKIDHGETERICNYDSKYTTKIPKHHKNHIMKYESNLLNFNKSKQNLKNNKLIANLKPGWGVI